MFSLVKESSLRYLAHVYKTWVKIISLSHVFKTFVSQIRQNFNEDYFGWV